MEEAVKGLEFGVLLKERGSTVGQGSGAQNCEQPESVAAWGEKTRVGGEVLGQGRTISEVPTWIRPGRSLLDRRGCGGSIEGVVALEEMGTWLGRTKGLAPWPGGARGRRGIGTATDQPQGFLEMWPGPASLRRNRVVESTGSEE